TKKINDNQTEVIISLRDEVYPFFVELHYVTNYKENVIEQWSVLRHQEKKPVKLHKYASANLSLKGANFYLRSYHGDWIAEMQPEDERLTHGIKTLDSKLGTRTNLFRTSYFALGIDNPATEHVVTVLMRELSWNGNIGDDCEKDHTDDL